MPSMEIIKTGAAATGRIEAAIKEKITPLKRRRDSELIGIPPARKVNPAAQDERPYQSAPVFPKLSSRVPGHGELYHRQSPSE
jgi:hypothetical protein